MREKSWSRDGDGMVRERGKACMERKHGYGLGGTGEKDSRRAREKSCVKGKQGRKTWQLLEVGYRA